MALVAVLAAIALIWNASRRHARHPPAAIENTPIENAAPAAAPPAAEAAPAVNPAQADDSVATARKQAAIARVVEAGRPGLTACYQRALVRDDSLVHGKVTVRASIAASGRVDTVSVVGPAAFHAMQPCLQAAISKWDFPAAPAPYAAEFPLALRASQ